MTHMYIGIAQGDWPYVIGALFLVVLLLAWSASR